MPHDLFIFSITILGWVALVTRDYVLAIQLRSSVPRVDDDDLLSFSSTTWGSGCVVWGAIAGGVAGAFITRQSYPLDTMIAGMVGVVVACLLNFVVTELGKVRDRGSRAPLRVIAFFVAGTLSYWLAATAVQTARFGRDFLPDIGDLVVQIGLLSTIIGIIIGLMNIAKNLGSKLRSREDRE